MVNEHLKKLSDAIDALGIDAVKKHVDWVIDPVACANHLMKYGVSTREGDREQPISSHLKFAISMVAKNEGRPKPEWSKIDGYPYTYMHHHYGLIAQSKRVLIARHHPGLDAVFDASPWEGGLWIPSLLKLEGAVEVGPRQFSGSYRSSQRCIAVPAEYFETHSITGCVKVNDRDANDILKRYG